MIIAMILAGGIGSRVGADRPKQFVKVLGKPVLAYTIEIFQKHPQVDAIEVVCHNQWQEYLKDMIKMYNLWKVRWVTEGGKSFQDSVINGLQTLKNEKNMDFESTVLIHYGAAPFTSQKVVTDCIKVTEERGSAFSATPCYQLMGTNDKIENSQQFAEGDSVPEISKDTIPVSRKWIDRDQCIQIACPQGYKLRYLSSIYKRAEQKGLLETTDPHTTSLMYKLGDTLYQSYGEQINIKITTAEDIKLFEGYAMLKHRNFNEI